MVHTVTPDFCSPITKSFRDFLVGKRLPTLIGDIRALIGLTVLRVTPVRYFFSSRNFQTSS